MYEKNFIYRGKPFYATGTGTKENVKRRVSETDE